ncbi:LAMI_0B08152g1_1 [Lachancea mirantina]|uniref:LAMI_0B08152g1_1 n=1 Tax=Lachancea mirantina TaxID=1230905 RepID=A0A1G4IXN9_9SACH|nr:LAMI_0B08152g1_1 [Lachancea mirantina]
MAPPTPILGPEELDRAKGQVLKPCKLMSLTQNECRFDGHEYVCIPFKRVFQECQAGKGKHKHTLRFEVTTAATNERLASDEMVQRFWDASLH